ncbi:MAG: hypothetical protein M0R06_15515 [Sphaerochaeta sp.]|jgi:hypothetical protein|nr:hypothetical protein [Sphaerochaeta sp.]
MCNDDVGLTRICHDEDCPECDWPETYLLVDFSEGPISVKKIGCARCGWSEAVGDDA